MIICNDRNVDVLVLLVLVAFLSRSDRSLGIVTWHIAVA
jgi:hypothetical protein